MLMEIGKGLWGSSMTFPSQGPFSVGAVFKASWISVRKPSKVQRQALWEEPSRTNGSAA